jgi:hypothetical protein
MGDEARAFSSCAVESHTMIRPTAISGQESSARLVGPAPVVPLDLPTSARMLNTLRVLESQYQRMVESKIGFDESLHAPYARFAGLKYISQDLQAQLTSIHKRIARALMSRRGQLRKGNESHEIEEIESDIAALYRLRSILKDASSTQTKVLKNDMKSDNGLGLFSMVKSLHNEHASADVLTELQQLKVAITIRKHRNQIRMKRAMGTREELQSVVSGYERELAFEKKKTIDEICAKYTALIASEQQCRDAKLQEASALLKRKVYLMSDKMAQDFETKKGNLEMESEKEQERFNESNLTAQEHKLKLRQDIEELESRLAGNEFQSLLNDKGEDLENKYGKKQKKELRHCWNFWRTPTQEIFDFLWEVTGCAYSDSANKFTQDTCHNLSKFASIKKSRKPREAFT